MKRAKFWSRTPGGSLTLVEGEDASEVSVRAWKAYNKAFLRWYLSRSHYPLDPMDAYQRGCAAMVTVAAGIAAGSITLERAEPDTYVISTGIIRLKDFAKYRVQPARVAYRKMFDGCRVDGKLDVRAFAEALPGLSGAERETARRLAHECLEETFAELDGATVAGLRGWLAADGNQLAAAKAAGIARSTYPRRFRKWCEAFRKACKWSW